MPRYIDADALCEEIKLLRISLGGKDIFGEEARESILTMISEQPTADVVEVVHGEWEFISLDGSLWCSRCKRPSGYVRKAENKYCPNCGAKMDGERKEV